MIATLCFSASLLLATASAAKAPDLPPLPEEPEPPLEPKLTGDPKWLQRLYIRPGHTQQLTKDNFDAWIKEAVDAKKTAFVRWISTDDTQDCSWIAARHHSKGYIPTPKKEEHCKLLSQSSQLWNAVAEKHKDDDTVVFGDVVLSEWKDLVAEITKERLQTYTELTPEEEEELHNRAETDEEGIFVHEVRDLDHMYAMHMTAWGTEDALPAEDEHNPMKPHNFGCTIRSYNKASGYYGGGWSPECKDFVHMADEDMIHDDLHDDLHDDPHHEEMSPEEEDELAKQAEEAGEAPEPAGDGGAEHLEGEQDAEHEAEEEPVHEETYAEGHHPEDISSMSVDEQYPEGISLHDFILHSQEALQHFIHNEQHMDEL